MQEMDSKRDPMFYNSMKGYGPQEYGNESRSQSASLANDEEFKRKVKALMKSREQLKQQNAELQNQNAELQSQNSELHNQVLSLQAQLGDLKNSGDGRRQQDSRMNAIIENSNRKIEALMSERDALVAEKKELMGRISRAEKSSPNKDDELSLKIGRVLIEAQASAQRIVSDAENEAHDVREETAGLSNSFLKDVEAAKAELETMKSSMAGITSSLNSRVDVMLGMLYGAQRYFTNHVNTDKGNLNLDV